MPPVPQSLTIPRHSNPLLRQPPFTPTLARHAPTESSLATAVFHLRVLRVPHLDRSGARVSRPGRAAGGMIGHPEAAGMQERAHDGEAGAEDGDGGFEVEPDGWWQVDPGDVHGLGELDEDDETDDVEGAGAVGCVSYRGWK